MSAQHTPGRWHTNGFFLLPGGATQIVDDYERQVAIASVGTYGSTGHAANDATTSAANARLIAVAPELLTAAAEFLKYFERVSLIEVSSDLAASLVALREAVAKAEGGAA